MKSVRAVTCFYGAESFGFQEGISFLEKEPEASTFPGWGTVWVLVYSGSWGGGRGLDYLRGSDAFVGTPDPAPAKPRPVHQSNWPNLRDPNLQPGLFSRTNTALLFLAGQVLMPPATAPESVASQSTSLRSGSVAVRRLKQLFYFLYIFFFLRGVELSQKTSAEVCTPAPVVAVA